MKSLKIAIFGTPDVSARYFEKISDFAEIVAAVTAPDRPAGRGKKLQKSPVKIFAESRGIPVFSPEKLDAEFAEKLKNLGAEIFLVFAFGRIFPEDFLNAFPKIWNLHPSLLPKFRGPTPIPTVILAGETVSGVTVFAIEAGMDSGDILAKKSFDITEMRADAVFDRAIDAGAELTIELFQNPEKIGKKQDSTKASYCGKIEKLDGLLQPKIDIAETALRKIRAFFPWPSAFLSDGTKFLRAQKSEQNVSAGEFKIIENRVFFGFSDAAIEILEIQIPGKKVISAEEFSQRKKR